MLAYLGYAALAAACGALYTLWLVIKMRNSILSAHEAQIAYNEMRESVLSKQAVNNPGFPQVQESAKLTLAEVKRELAILRAATPVDVIRNAGPKLLERSRTLRALEREKRAIEKRIEKLQYRHYYRLQAKQSCDKPAKLERLTREVDGLHVQIQGELAALRKVEGQIAPWNHPNMGLDWPKLLSVKTLTVKAPDNPAQKVATKKMKVA